jgi:hypothetical protein
MFVVWKHSIVIAVSAFRATSTATLVLAIAALLAGCSETQGSAPLYYPTSVFGSTLPPIATNDGRDPYHYRCSGQCAAGF